MDSEEKTYTMSEVASELGVSSDRIRRYCNLGLVPGLRYSIGRHRNFTVEQLNWLRILCFLGKAGFSNKDLRRFAQLERQKSSKARREQRAMVLTHKRQVWQEFEDLKDILDFMDRYGESLEKAV